MTEITTLPISVKKFPELEQTVTLGDNDQYLIRQGSSDKRVSNSTVRTDMANFSLGSGYCTVARTADVYTLEPTNNRGRIGQLRDGMRFYAITEVPIDFIAGVSRINLHNTGLKNLVSKNPLANAIPSNSLTYFDLVYNLADDNFEILNTDIVQGTAATRDIGIAPTNVPEFIEDAGLSGFGYGGSTSNVANINTITRTSFFSTSVNTQGTFPANSSKVGTISTTVSSTGFLTQQFYDTELNTFHFRRITNISIGVWSTIQSVETSIRPPIGSILFHTGNVAPTNYLALNGASYARSVYPELYAWASGGNTSFTTQANKVNEAFKGYYGTGNGVSTFSLPDFRDEFIRVAGDTRTILSLELDQIKSHTHTVAASRNIGGFTDNGSAPDQRSIERSFESSAFGGDETRPRNLGVLACVRYAN